eukprot:TRINITY_DN2394_c0_g1_i1.p1 TRINITY_DN2394_c0_g1~~TRINITY_DN2394_c0_g1_i1.p1  ORF type:complete len:591 (-),score=140.90 TRINITY_DN2394_c0_g1_i1:129-1865(-)
MKQQGKKLLQQFALNARAGVEVRTFDAADAAATQKVEPLCVNEQGARGQFSADGKVVVHLNAGVTFKNADSGETILSVPHPRVARVAVSPMSRYALTWEPLENDSARNLLVWSLAPSAPEPLARFARKAPPSSDAWPLIQWTTGEELCGRLVSDGVEFYKGNLEGSVQAKLSLPGVRGFSFARRYSIVDGVPQVLVAAFVPEKKGVPAAVAIYQYPRFGDSMQLSRKSFFKAETCDLLWSFDSRSLLCLSKTDADPSGKSYYGQTGLHIMFPSDASSNAIVTLKKEGPIHHVSWNPVASMFCVIYGFMPATATIFSLQGFRHTPKVDIGPAHRNSAYFSPDGKILCLGGFGNLQGELDFWTTDTFEKLGSAQAHCATACQWSPDSRYFACAVCAPRMRVDNGFKIFTPDGSLVYSVPAQDLYEFIWRPCTGDFSKRSRSLQPAAKSNSPAPVASPPPAPAEEKYRPPHAPKTLSFSPLNRDEDAAVSVTLYGARAASAAAAAEPAVPKAPLHRLPVGCSEDQDVVPQQRKAKGGNKKKGGKQNKSNQQPQAPAEPMLVIEEPTEKKKKKKKPQQKQPQ